MPITVRQLARKPELGIVVRTGASNLDRELSWAHVSELADPTAFLSGGELLLTTGISLPDGQDAIEEHVRRLAGAGVAAVGFGIGLRHAEIPDAFVHAASIEQLPLLEIPLDVPFIQLEKAVSQALSTDDHARLQRGYQHQRSLIHATLSDEGEKALVRRTATIIGGWAALLDASGHLIDSSHRNAYRAVDMTADARRARPRETVFATERGEDVISQPLIAHDGRPLGYLVAGREGVVGSLDHGVVNIAASLLTLFVRRTERIEQGMARARSAALTMMLSSGTTGPVAALADVLWGGLPVPPLKVVIVRGAPARLQQAMQALDTFADGSVAFGLLRGGLILIVTDSAVDATAARVAAIPDLCLGVSSAVGWEELDRGERESRRAADEALAGGMPIHFEAIADRGLSSFLDRERARTYAAAHLGALDAAEGGTSNKLRRTLFVWLSHNGHADPAARALGIHRHTLRRRLDRIEDILGVSLDVPTTRAELWLEFALVEESADVKRNP